MIYVHIKNLERFNPGYTDRKHIWAKIYWDILLDENFQELVEVDKYRLISLIVSEVYMGKPIPLTNANLVLMGWDSKKRSISLTIQMLHTFISDVSKPCPRVEKNRVDKNIYSIYSNTPNQPLIKAVIEDLNKLCSTSYKPTIQKTGKHISARISEGHTLEDFKKVNKIKVSEWKGTDMEKYLRPETLYGTKFESYLNQKEKSVKRYV